MKKSFNLQSFYGVRVGLASAMRDAGFETPQALWDHISSMDWSGGERTGKYFESTYALQHFAALVYGAHVVNNQNRFYNADTEFSIWADIIASVLERDTEDLFGLSETGVPYQTGPKQIQAIVEDEEGFFILRELKKLELLKAARDFRKGVLIDQPLTRAEFEEFLATCVLMPEEDIFESEVLPDTTDGGTVVLKSVRADLAKTLGVLDPLQAEAIGLNFGFGSGEGLNYREVGETSTSPCTTEGARLRVIKGLSNLTKDPDVNAGLQESYELIC